MIRQPNTSAHASSPSREYLIEARGICLQWGGRRILDRVDLSIARGEIITLVGLNGSGKTTLVRIMVGLLAPDAGKVTRIPGLRIGFSPQAIPRDPTLPITVKRFLTLGADAARARLDALLEEVGIGNLLDSQLANLSGGEFHRVILARALLRQPDLLVLDEPMAGVDISGQTELYRLIAQIRDQRGCGVLLVSHDLHMVMAATDYVVCLNHHVCCTGRPESVTQHPEFVSLFGKRVSDVLTVYTHHHNHLHNASGEAVPITDGTKG
uniref:Zinc transport system ATP-binding protein n=1 Tax=Candidatus Kentrum sp. MB TaxID=2138164 RepID=A0A450XJK3_9GAMM|nr:MAG: zinc transport system ATP-binding protein [Candidatus Kentron sp. MB]VFK33681.1 MAG: zinc transport system ATP-binding protein [Candidatus Kentron sp. MB]VFK76299.1 MAG: zinc transport system ATP-binding protein [Candidatus Kentron sp. MB]